MYVLMKAFQYSFLILFCSAFKVPKRWGLYFSTDYIPYFISRVNVPLCPTNLTRHEPILDNNLFSRKADSPPTDVEVTPDALGNIAVSWQHEISDGVLGYTVTFEEQLGGSQSYR